ncbi:hypothetical protein CBR_g36456 [Chara braunii]|uniref:Phosphorylated adapter RNA export protein n=1 Tax=Chara braunii TaxID=69332 RepID=A0A388LKT4_CHABU|nr:hypothetical protein CBR_g36456 [Chara braunii]|eukprot:GBG82929.1 hypothetical protein CBR_g36456 [Chara braunii]
MEKQNGSGRGADEGNPCEGGSTQEDSYGAEPMDIDEEWEWSYDSGDDNDFARESEFEREKDVVHVATSCAGHVALQEEDPDETTRPDCAITTDEQNAAKSLPATNGIDEIDELIKGAKRKITRIVWDRSNGIRDDNSAGDGHRERSSAYSKKNKKRRRKPQKFNIDKFVKDTCWRLQEKKFFLVWRLVDLIGVRGVQELIKEVEAIEAAGGQMTAAGDRRRTPGGVMWNVLKGRMDPAEYKELMAPEVEAKKELKKKQSRCKRTRMAVDRRGTDDPIDATHGEKGVEEENGERRSESVWKRISEPNGMSPEEVRRETHSSSRWSASRVDPIRAGQKGERDQDLPERWECVRGDSTRTKVRKEVLQDRQAYSEGDETEEMQHVESPGLVDAGPAEYEGPPHDPTTPMPAAREVHDAVRAASDQGLSGGDEDGEFREEEEGEFCDEAPPEPSETLVPINAVLERSIADKISADLRPKEDWQIAWAEAVRQPATISEDGKVSQSVQ